MTIFAVFPGVDAEACLMHLPESVGIYDPTDEPGSHRALIPGLFIQVIFKANHVMLFHSCWSCARSDHIFRHSRANARCSTNFHRFWSRSRTRTNAWCISLASRTTPTTMEQHYMVSLENYLYEQSGDKGSVRPNTTPDAVTGKPATPSASAVHVLQIWPRLYVPAEA